MKTFLHNYTIENIIYLGNAEHCVPLGVDGVLAVQLDGGEGVSHQGATLTDPFNSWGGFTTEPEVIPDWAALFQRDVVHTVALKVGWH